MLQSNHHHQQTNTQFLQAGCPSCRPTNSVKALKGTKSHSMDLLTPSSPGVFQLLSLTTNSSWLPWGRVAMPSALWCQCQYPSPPSTGEHSSGDTNKLWLWAYTEHVDECPANVAWSGADQTSCSQTSAYQWWLVLHHSAHAEACNTPRQPSQHGVNYLVVCQHETQWKHVQVLLRTRCQGIIKFDESDGANRSMLNICQKHAFQDWGQGEDIISGTERWHTLWLASWWNRSSVIRRYK